MDLVFRARATGFGCDRAMLRSFNRAVQGCHLYSERAGLGERLRTQSGCRGTCYELTDIAEPTRTSLRDCHRQDIAAIAVLQHLRARKGCGIRQESWANTPQRSHVSGPQQLERSIRSVGVHECSMPQFASQGEIHTVIAHHPDANSRLVSICNLTEGGARPHRTADG